MEDSPQPVDDGTIMTGVTCQCDTGADVSSTNDPKNCSRIWYQPGSVGSVGEGTNSAKVWSYEQRGNMDVAYQDTITHEWDACRSKTYASFRILKTSSMRRYSTTTWAMQSTKMQIA